MKKIMDDEQYAYNITEEARELFEKLLELDAEAFSWSGFVETLVRHEERDDLEEILYFLKEVLDER